MEQLAFRNLIGVAYTEAEVKEFAEEYEYAADPDEEGNPTTRPGKLSDYFPNPYPNEEAAKFANSGESVLYKYISVLIIVVNTCMCIGTP
jgi:ubiquinol-cytochrome c reductase cytochrome c1 subunit